MSRKGERNTLKIKKILVVDDEPDLCSVLKYTLEAAGDFEVHSCTHGALAVQEVLRLKPDLIFLDIIMAGVWGGEVADQLKRLRETRQIPIVFITVLPASDKLRKEHQIEEGEPVLEKPLEISKLLKVIAEVSKEQERKEEVNQQEIKDRKEP